MPEKETSGSQRPAAAKSARRRKLDIWNKIAVAILTCFLVGCISVFLDRKSVV